MGENRYFWLLWTSLIFQVNSWELDVNLLEPITHGTRTCIKRKKKYYGNFFYFVQINIYINGLQKMKIRPLKDFEKMRFLCFYIIKSMARKGYFGPKSDFRGSKIPPRGASLT